MEPEGSLLRPQQPATFPVLSQINPVHVVLSYFFTITLNIIHCNCQDPCDKVARGLEGVKCH